MKTSRHNEKRAINNYFSKTSPNCDHQRLTFLFGRGLVISMGWYRVQRSIKPGNTKKIREKIAKSPILGRARKCEGNKKTEKLRKWPENHNFRDFFVFFRTFGAQPVLGDLVYFLSMSSKVHSPNPPCCPTIRVEGVSCLSMCNGMQTANAVWLKTQECS